MPDEKETHHPTIEEEQKIKELKLAADSKRREGWRPHETPSARIDHMSFEGVSKHFETDFVKLVSELSERFKERIEVLFEGSGFSRFPEVLSERCKKIGVKVRVFRTDLYSKQVFQEEAAGLKIDTKNYRTAAPEELVRIFGKNRFHLVISRSGGLTYTPVSQVKGIHNVCKLLKTGGEAHVFSENVSKPLLPRGREIRLLKRFGGSATRIGEFFTRNPQYHVEEVEHWAGPPIYKPNPILRIRKLAER